MQHSIGDLDAAGVGSKAGRSICFINLLLKF